MLKPNKLPALTRIREICGHPQNRKEVKNFIIEGYLVRTGIKFDEPRLLTHNPARTQKGKKLAA